MCEVSISSSFSSLSFISYKRLNVKTEGMTRLSYTKSDFNHRGMMCNKGLHEDDMQKLDTTEPEQRTDQKLLLSTISAADLARKTSGG